MIWREKKNVSSNISAVDFRETNGTKANLKIS